MWELAPLNILGQSAAFLETLRLIKKFAHSRAPVLIEGETGTGKELAARALHYLGPRKGQPFIPVNCGALPDPLFENELFGHEKGAFTDAKNSQPGLIAQAQGGTLFLDEVDSLSARAQVTLLRFLQDNLYRPLGSTKLIEGAVCIVAAANINLESQVKRGEFREDLFYRLNVVKLSMPALRERREDICLLARHFLRTHSQIYEKAPCTFHPESLEWLELRQWPGNVRQLENLIHREFLLADKPVIRIDPDRYESSTAERPFVTLKNTAFKCGFKEIREMVIHDFEKQYLHQLMLKTRGNVSQAAVLARKERRSLGRLLKEHGINRQNYLIGAND